MDDVKRVYLRLVNGIFMRDGYKLAREALVDLWILAEAIEACEDDHDSLWYLGEGEPASLADLIVGAYWFTFDTHRGPRDLAYQVLTALGRIYRPGITTGPTGAERDTYDGLVALMPAATEKSI